MAPERQSASARLVPAWRHPPPSAPCPGSSRPDVPPRPGPPSPPSPTLPSMPRTVSQDHEACQGDHGDHGRWQESRARDAHAGPIGPWCAVDAGWSIEDEATGGAPRPRSEDMLVWTNTQAPGAVGRNAILVCEYESMRHYHTCGRWVAGNFVRQELRTAWNHDLNICPRRGPCKQGLYAQY